MPRLVQLIEANLQLATKQVACMVGRVTENILHAHKTWLLIHDNARIGRDRYLARGEGVERVDGLIARLIVGNVNDNLHLVSGQIIHLLNLNLAILVGL